MEEIYISRYGTVMIGKKPKNYMKKWTREEEELLKEKWFERKISVHDIAEILGRSYTSIHKRICLIALKEIEEKKMPAEQIAEKYHLSIDDIEVKNVKNIRDSNSEIIELLQDVKKILIHIGSKQ